MMLLVACIVLVVFTVCLYVAILMIDLLLQLKVCGWPTIRPRPLSPADPSSSPSPPVISSNIAYQQ